MYELWSSAFIVAISARGSQSWQNMDPPARATPGNLVSGISDSEATAFMSRMHKSVSKVRCVVIFLDESLPERSVPLGKE